MLIIKRSLRRKNDGQIAWLLTQENALDVESDTPRKLREIGVRMETDHHPCCHILSPRRKARQPAIDETLHERLHVRVTQKEWQRHEHRLDTVVETAENFLSTRRVDDVRLHPELCRRLEIERLESRDCRRHVAVQNNGDPVKGHGVAEFLEVRAHVGWKGDVIQISDAARLTPSRQSLHIGVDDKRRDRRLRQLPPVSEFARHHVRGD